jgi:hypothetical protein
MSSSFVLWRSAIHGRLGAGKLSKVWCPTASKAAVYANSTTPASSPTGNKKPGAGPHELHLDRARTFPLAVNKSSPDNPTDSVQVNPAVTEESVILADDKQLLCKGGGSQSIAGVFMVDDKKSFTKLEPLTAKEYVTCE